MDIYLKGRFTILTKVSVKDIEKLDKNSELHLRRRLEENRLYYERQTVELWIYHDKNAIDVFQGQKLIGSYFVREWIL
jgi:hypothetical protein